MFIHSYRLIYHMNYHDLKNKSFQTKVKSFYGTSDYLPLSAIHEAKALFKSTIKKDVLFAIQFHQNKDSLETRIKMKHNTPKKAVAYQLVHKGEYFIIKAIFHKDEPIIHTNKEHGCVGIDINRNHLALMEVNKDLIFITARG